MSTIPSPGYGGAAPGRRRGKANRWVEQFQIEQVAYRLGNTPSVCRKCYVHPDVIGAFLDGSLAKDAGLARATAARPARSSGGLRPDEKAVLALLERREAEARRGNRLETQLRRSLQGR